MKVSRIQFVSVTLMRVCGVARGNVVMQYAKPMVFGFFSYIMRRFDSFRDGRASELMGCFLQWVVEGCRADRSKGGLSRRYGDLRSEDKLVCLKEEVPL